MAACPSEIGGEIVELVNARHRAPFFGIDISKQKPLWLVGCITQAHQSGGVRLAPGKAMHTHPQVLLARASLDRLELARELGTQ